MLCEGRAFRWGKGIAGGRAGPSGPWLEAVRAQSGAGKGLASLQGIQAQGKRAEAQATIRAPSFSC